jgi:hypothetical protein
VTATAAILAAQNHFNSGSATADKGEKLAQGAPVRKAYFGDLHVHTGWSNDAYQIDLLHGKGRQCYDSCTRTFWQLPLRSL